MLDNFTVSCMDSTLTEELTVIFFTCGYSFHIFDIARDAEVFSTSLSGKIAHAQFPVSFGLGRSLPLHLPVALASGTLR